MAVVRFILRSSLRVGVAVVGFGLLAAGVVMLLTPGPGMVVIIAGLAVLATQFAWAQRVLDQARQRAALAKELAMRRAADRRRERGQA